VRISKRATNPDGTKVENRKSHRFPVMVPVEVSWRGPDGKAVKADAVARQVNVRGGFLVMETYPELGSRVSLTNFLSAQTVEARVLATPQTRAGVSGGIVVELVTCSEEFWGVDLQVKKTAVELRKLEVALGSQGLDLRLLSEFRDAVDYIRGVAAVAQQLRELQLRGADDYGLHSEIAAGRIRRTAKLCREVAADLDSASAKPLSVGLNGAAVSPNSNGTDAANTALNAGDLDELRRALAKVSAYLKRFQSRHDPSREPARDLVSRS